MDFLKTLLVYLTVTMATGVQQGPPLEDVPIPTATPYVEVQQEENASGLQVELPETPAPPTATPNPNPTLTPNKSYKNVAYGDSGSAVKKLQRRLIELGYLPEKSDDGKFGYQTLNAVRAFQEKNGLKKDGVAGAATLTHLYQDPDAVPAVTPTIAPTDTPEPPAPPTEAPSEVAEISVPEPIAAPESGPDADVNDMDVEAEEADAPAADLPVVIAEPAASDGDQEPVEGPIEGLFLVKNATIALGESGAPLAALRLSDGVMKPFYPRIWQNASGEAVVSLRDMAETIGGWTLEIAEDDENCYILTAAGYEIIITVTDDGIGCIVDGESMPFESYDLQSDGSDLYVTESFLRQALKANVLWDDDEHTLMLTVPDKEAAQAND